MAELLGWAATAVFAGSYFFARVEALRRVQMAGALMWVAYGLLIAAPPVVAANVLVFGAAAWTMAARRADRRRGAMRGCDEPRAARASPRPPRTTTHARVF